MLRGNFFGISEIMRFHSTVVPENKGGEGGEKGESSPSPFTTSLLSLFARRERKFLVSAKTLKHWRRIDTWPKERTSVRSGEKENRRVVVFRSSRLSRIPRPPKTEAKIINSSKPNSAVPYTSSTRTFPLDLRARSLSSSKPSRSFPTR